MQVVTLVMTWSMVAADPEADPQQLHHANDRTFDVGRGVSGLVSGGFDKIGYIPLSAAVAMCEGQARFR